MFVSSKKSLLSFVLCASLVSASTAFPQSAEQWRRLPGPKPEGASINALFSHGDYLFAGTSKGIFRSTDQGQSWKGVNLPETNPRVTSFTAIGETLFVGCKGFMHWGIFRSTDNGLTWKPMENVGDINVLAAIGGRLFAGLNDPMFSPSGIACSTDNGKNWTLVGKEVAATSIHSLAVIGAELFAGASYCGFRSSDLGNNWTKINVSIATPHGPVDDIACNAFAVIGKQLFVGTDYGVFVSTDQGMNWRPINNGLPGFDVKSVKSFAQDARRNVKTLAVSGDTLFASDWDLGVFRFDNRSQSWKEVNNGLFNPKVNSFAVSGGKLFVGTEAGVWVTTDNGENWKSANSGMVANHGVGEIAVRDNRLLVQGFGGVFASADNGNTWTPVKDSIEPDALQIPPEWKRGSLNKKVDHLASINDVVIAGTGGGVFRSTDRGQTWEESNRGLPYGERGAIAPSIEALAVIGAKIYAGLEDNGLFISDDLGRSWTEASRDLRDLTVSGMVRKGDKLFASTPENGVFVSLDQGRHWKEAGEFFPGKEILSLAGIGDHLLALTSDNIYFSIDEGRSWMASETGFTGPYPGSFVVSGGKIFAGINSGLLVSSDQGQSWTKLGVIGQQVAIYALAATEGRLLAGTSGGVFLSTDDGRNWKQLGENFRFSKGALSLAVNGMNILVGSDMGNIFLSPDLGQSWAMVNAGIEPPARYLNQTKVWKISVAGATLLIAETDDGLFVSTNLGQTWRPTIHAGKVSTIKVIGSAIFAGGAGGVLISKDNGRSWTPSAIGLNNPYPVEAFAVKGDRIYVAQQGVYVSSDGGGSWTPINDGLPNTRMVGLVVNDTHLFVRTYDGALFARRL